MILLSNQNQEKSLLNKGQTQSLLHLEVLFENSMILTFIQEKIVERSLFAKGSGAHGYFELSGEMSQFTKAKFLNGKIGKQTPLFVRFSPSLVGERGVADTIRDIKGMQMKFYTEEGNYDLITMNTQVFYINDMIKLPDLMHAMRPSPQAHLFDSNSFWDYLSLMPESINQAIYTYAHNFIPDGYEHMNTYSINTYKWLNSNGETFYVRYHVINSQAQEFYLISEQAQDLYAQPDFYAKRLFELIENGTFPEWEISVQILNEKDANNFKYDVNDPTKTWDGIALKKLGKIVLNKNPDNHFAEVEQVAFNHGHFVDGIQASDDKLLQGFIFLDQDDTINRLGANYDQIPINRPYRAGPQNSYSRDGEYSTHGNYGHTVNYYPNSQNGPVDSTRVPVTTTLTSSKASSSKAGADDVVVVKKKSYDNFELAAARYKNMPKYEKDVLASNLTIQLRNIKQDIRERMISLLEKVSVDLAANIRSQI
eukprot:403372668